MSIETQSVLRKLRKAPLRLTVFAFSLTVHLDPFPPFR
jgi:hypothetical protein